MPPKKRIKMRLLFGAGEAVPRWRRLLCWLGLHVRQIRVNYEDRGTYMVCVCGDALFKEPSSRIDLSSPRA